MYKLLTLISIIASTRLFSYVAAADIPAYPEIWDPNFPMNRCVDFCAFLRHKCLFMLMLTNRPGQICPTRRTDVECLCDVFNIRLPAVALLHIPR